MSHPKQDPDPRPSCGKCRYFDRQTKGDMQIGLCRVNPPIPAAFSMTKWLTVSVEDWCGAFDRKAEW